MIFVACFVQHSLSRDFTYRKRRMDMTHSAYWMKRLQHSSCWISGYRSLTVGEVLEEMRQQQKRVPVVIVTASDDELAGFDVKCVMRKPVTPEKLIATVMNCLSK